MSWKKSTKNKTYHSSDVLNGITNCILEDIELLYETFGVRHQIAGHVAYSRCFIHGGDNPSALNVYHRPDYRAHYKCRTHGCEHHFGSSIISLIRGALSHRVHGWTVAGDPEVSFNDTISFICKSWDIDYNNITPTKIDTTHTKFNAIVKALSEDRPQGQFKREDYIKSVQIPSPYFMDRGYSAAILCEYDVGDCHTPGKEMCGRAVVPIYDDQGAMIVGVTGRSVYDPCPQCSDYHKVGGKCIRAPKWRNNSGFRRDQFLYNYWKARQKIQEMGTAVLVESPGNVWRLEEAGICNALAIFGTELTPGQRHLLDTTGALNIIIIMDNDTNNSGQAAAKRIAKQLGHTYNISTYFTKKNDIGSMSVEEVQSDILPFVRRIVDDSNRWVCG